MANRGKRSDYASYYHLYLFGRRTLADIANGLKISIPTLRKHFDSLASPANPKLGSKEAINCILDATFFGRAYGYLSFHDTTQIIYAKEIKTESLKELNFCLDELIKAGYTFKSFTLDGKRGFISRLKARFPATPIQMCLLHQKMIVRRYITACPKTDCGRDLKRLMDGLLQDNLPDFTHKLIDLKTKYQSVLAEKNSAGKFKQQSLRSAVRSIETNKLLLFQYKLYPALNIPHTTNHIEAAFSHLKEKINIHRGLNIKRKKRAIISLLMNSSKKY